MGGHEVVFKVEVGEVVAVEQLGGELLQTAAGQVDGVHPLRGDLTQGDNAEKVLSHAAESVVSTH